MPQTNDDIQQSSLLPGPRPTFRHLQNAVTKVGWGPENKVIVCAYTNCKLNTIYTYFEPPTVNIQTTVSCRVCL